eukprot:2494906-Amphidinium_carterae.1
MPQQAQGAAPPSFCYHFSALCATSMCICSRFLAMVTPRTVHPPKFSNEFIQILLRLASQNRLFNSQGLCAAFEKEL